MSLRGKLQTILDLHGKQVSDDELLDEVRHLRASLELLSVTVFEYTCWCGHTCGPKFGQQYLDRTDESDPPPEPAPTEEVVMRCHGCGATVKEWEDREEKHETWCDEEAWYIHRQPAHGEPTED